MHVTTDGTCYEITNGYTTHTNASSCRGMGRHGTRKGTKVLSLGNPPPKKKKHTTSQRGNSSFHDIFNYLRWSTCEVINTPSHEGSALASCLSAMINWMDSGFRICQESGICSSRYIKFIFIFHRVVPPAYVSWFATTLSIELSCPLGLIKPSLLVNNPASSEFWGFPPNSRATPSISK